MIAWLNSGLSGYESVADSLTLSKFTNQIHPMETLLLICNLVLIVVIGGLVWLVYQLLQKNQQDVVHHRDLMARQLRLSTVPHLYCDLQWDEANQQVQLFLYNVGNVPAYDMHISGLAAYVEERLDIATFMRLHVQPRHRKYPLQADPVGYYGVRSTARVPCLSAQKQVALDVGFPVRPADVYVLIQTRDLSGDNYYQLYCFSDISPNGDYKANLLEPKTVAVLERLHLYDLENFDPTTCKKPLPYHLKQFLALWNHAMSVRVTTKQAEPETMPPIFQTPVEQPPTEPQF